VASRNARCAPLLSGPATRNLAHEHLVDDDGEAVHVGPRVEIGEARGLLGLMYPGVPSGNPVRVRLAPPAVLIALAIPKSATIGCPCENSTFSA